MCPPALRQYIGVRIVAVSRFWKSTIGRLALVAAVVASGYAGASAATNGAAPQSVSTVDGIVHVVRTGWHSGIIVPRETALAGSLAAARGIPEAAWLEFGWGDRDYFTTPDPDLGQALVAGFVPTESVMHVVGHNSLPRSRADTVEVVEVPLSAAERDRLVADIAESFDWTAEGDAVPLANNPGTRGVFYPARGSFHLFNTCNTWVARRLAAAGVPLSPSGIITAEDLMDRLRRSLTGTGDSFDDPAGSPVYE